MKRYLAIEVDTEDDFCGKCRGLEVRYKPQSYSLDRGLCRIFNEPIDYWPVSKKYERCKECKEAEL